jgi:hypothetical protein
MISLNLNEVALNAEYIPNKTIKKLKQLKRYVLPATAKPGISELQRQLISHNLCSLCLLLTDCFWGDQLPITEKATPKVAKETATNENPIVMLTFS